MLEIVNQQQLAPIYQELPNRLCERVAPALLDAKAFSDCGGHPARIGGRCERHEGDAVDKGVLEAGRDLERQSRFPNAARPGESDQPDVVPKQQRSDRRCFSLPTDHWREGVGQLACAYVFWQRQGCAGGRARCEVIER